MHTLATHLPVDSPFAQALAGHGWTTTDQLLALTVDFLAGISWQLGGGKGAKPKPLPRPWDKTLQRIGGGTSYTPAELDLLLGRG